MMKVPYVAKIAFLSIAACSLFSFQAFGTTGEGDPLEHIFTATVSSAKDLAYAFLDGAQVDRTSAYVAPEKDSEISFVLANDKLYAFNPKSGQTPVDMSAVLQQKAASDADIALLTGLVQQVRDWLKKPAKSDSLTIGQGEKAVKAWKELLAKLPEVKSAEK